MDIPWVGTPIEEVETPALVVDLDILEANLGRAARYAGERGLAMYPHVKTHKTVEIALKQLEAGAAGLTAAKSEEAGIFAEETGAPLVLHYPVAVPEKAERLAGVAAEVPLTVALDSAISARTLSQALAAHSVSAEVLVELDVGLARTGVSGPGRALELAREIEAIDGLVLAGISCYPGHLRRGGGDLSDGLAGVGAILSETIDLFDRDGLDRSRVSGGSTATLFESHQLPYTEIRPGNYALLDRAEGRGSFTDADCALRVHTTVVSTPAPGRFVVDAGAKSLSEAAPPAGLDGYGEFPGRPGLTIEALSEEHGHGLIDSGEEDLAVGDRLEIIPNHACTCVNLHDVLYGVRGGALVSVMEVVARGAVR